MKKMIISFSLMFMCLFATVSVFAGSYLVKDEQGFATTSSDMGTAILSGYRDESTDRLSQVGTSKTQKGKVTVSFGSITRPSQYSAKVTGNFYLSGTLKSSAYLSI